MDKSVLKQIAETYGTPVVIYDEGKIIENYASLKSALPPNSQVVYSVKANPNPGVISVLNKCGAYFESASEGEYDLLLRTGIRPGRILFSGQAKSKQGILRAIDDGVFLFNIESMREALLLRDCSNKKHIKTKFLLRINPSLSENNAVLHMGSKPSPFGVDEEDVPNILEYVNHSDTRCVGFFMYNGSQYYDSKDIAMNTNYLCEFAMKMQREKQAEIHYLDFGGGFGVVENTTQVPLDLSELQQNLKNNEKYISKLKKGFFESGRYLVSNSGILVTSVVDVKKSKGKKFVVLDSGINSLGIKQFCYRLYNPFLISITANREAEKQIFVGPTCTTIDNVHEETEISRMEIGDLIGILECGAYLLSYSPINFCGHPISEEIMIGTDGTQMIIRKRGDIQTACGNGFVFDEILGKDK